MVDNNLKKVGSTAITAATGGLVPKPVSDLITNKVGKDPRIAESLNKIHGNNMMSQNRHNSSFNTGNGSEEVNDEDIPNYSDDSSGGESEEKDEENALIKEAKKKIMSKVLIALAPACGWLLLILVIFAVFSAMIAPISNTYDYLSDKVNSFIGIFKDNPKEIEYNDKMEKVKNYWLAKGVNINTELISATLFNQKDFGKYLDNENTSSEELSTAESVNDEIYNTAIKKIDLLAKFQIITIEYEWLGCSTTPQEINLSASNEPRDIAKNDGIFGFMTDEHNYQKYQIWSSYTLSSVLVNGTSKEVNQCINPHTKVQEGKNFDIDNTPKNYGMAFPDATKTVYQVDDTIEGVYYWNLIDEGFLEVYYEDYFFNINDSDMSARKIDLVDNIFSMIKEFMHYRESPENGNGNSFAYNNYTNENGTNIVTFYSNGCNSFAGFDNFIAPTSNKNISSYCGIRDLHGNGKNSGHYATDIPGSLNSDIFAMADGKIIGMGLGSNTGGFSEAFVNMFNIVSIQYEAVELNGKSYTFTSQYLHLAYNSARINPRTGVKFKVGDTIKKGEAVAGMGSTGYSSGVHLHLAIHDQNGFTYDARSLFK